MNETIAKTQVQQFKELFTGGMQKIREACQVYVKAVEENPELEPEFRAAFPQISESGWANIELVGRGAMDYRLLWEGGRARNRIKQLPPSRQAAVLDNGVPLLSKDGSELKVKVENLTPKQVEQVFGGNHIRTLAEQRAWIEAQSTVTTPVKTETVAEVRGKELIISRPCRMSRKELVMFLAQMEG